MMNLVQTQIVAGAIEIYDNAFPNCEEIISIVDSEKKWDRAHVGKDATINDIRTNDAIYFELLSYRAHIKIIELGQTLYQYLDDYGNRYGAGFSRIEPACLNRYSVGQEYKAHADDGAGVPRIISALIYMNDVEEGGETYFPLFDVTVQPKKGRLVIFPSNYAYIHEARPPKSGEKYSMAVWTTPIL